MQNDESINKDDLTCYSVCVSLPHLRPPPPLCGVLTATTDPHRAPPLLQTDFRAAVPHSAQQGAVKSFSAFRSASSRAGVRACFLHSVCACGVLNMAAAAAGTQWRSSCRYYLSLGAGGKKKSSPCRDHPVRRDSTLSRGES